MHAVVVEIGREGLFLDSRYLLLFGSEVKDTPLFHTPGVVVLRCGSLVHSYRTFYVAETGSVKRMSIEPDNHSDAVRAELSRQQFHDI
jgi:hypothetical protein